MVCGVWPRVDRGDRRVVCAVDVQPRKFGGQGQILNQYDVVPIPVIYSPCRVVVRSALCREHEFAYIRACSHHAEKPRSSVERGWLLLFSRYELRGGGRGGGRLDSHK